MEIDYWPWVWEDVSWVILDSDAWNILLIYTIYSTNIHRLFLSCWCLSMVGLAQILKASWTTEEIVMVWNSPLVNENYVTAMTFSGILFCGSWTICQIQAELMECLRIPSGVNFLWCTCWRSSQVPHHSVGLARICTQSAPAADSGLVPPWEACSTGNLVLRTKVWLQNLLALRALTCNGILPFQTVVQWCSIYSGGSPLGGYGDTCLGVIYL